MRYILAQKENPDIYQVIQTAITQIRDELLPRRVVPHRNTVVT